MVLHVKLVAAKAALVAVSLMAPNPDAPARRAEWANPETVPVAAVTFTYRASGDFQRDGRTVDAPWEDRTTRGFEIMKYQLSTAQYDACVSERACPARPLSQSRDPGLPAVLLSHEDASAYAAWISRKSGDRWRLPSDAEWRVAAGSRARDDALGVSDPSQRWLARYDAESEAAKNDEKLRPLGSRGANENGLYDLSGNVFEWTQDCFVRYAGDASGFHKVTENCGVRVVEGEHRAYVTDFVRDARGGGCAAGKPPTWLGVRLVREPRARPGFAQRLHSWLGGQA